ncbi:MAG: hypothetical protein IE909_12740 [Campylobacterales bacterium]|nr:hypothetical protein [Campylobacterales bacterium]
MNNKYWSNALKEVGVESETLMKSYYSSINKKDDYDKYFDDVIPQVCRRKHIREVAYLFFVWLYIINNAKVFVMPFSGIVFHKFFWKFEYILFKINGIKTIVLPYGSDAYMYSRIKSTSIKDQEIDSSYKFKFSIYKNDLIELLFKEKNVFGYLIFAEGDGRFNVLPHSQVVIDKKNNRHSTGSLQSIKKYQVDPLGNYVEVKQEKRQGTKKQI